MAELRIGKAVVAWGQGEREIEIGMVETAASLLVIGLFCAAGAEDLDARRISNRIVVAIAALALLRMLVASGTGFAEAGLDLVVAGLVFLGGAVLFRIGVLGGGDVKLMAAGALWLGAAATGAFVLATALAGGLLALAFVIAGRAGRRFGALPGLPYGVAIGFAGILATVGLI